jgi:hypothetical protein
MAFAISISSCKRNITQNNTEVQEVRDSSYKAAKVISYAVDGCSWMIELENGKKLQPDILKTEFQKENLPVWIKYTIKKGAVGICMAGTMINLIDIELRK